MENNDINTEPIQITRGNGDFPEEMKIQSCGSRCGCSNKLNVTNWLENMPEGTLATDIVEVRFKNTRKGFYKNESGTKLKTGDMVAVEASPGHDIGIVSLAGPLISRQIRKYRAEKEINKDMKKIYRKAKVADIEKWMNAITLEKTVMYKARFIAQRLNLSMKIGDVEFQGDKTKAIFYYIADERVDFRELIRVLADEFKIRIEMKQIGARQEAGRIGGLGTCGRELCCSTWMTNFSSVSTNAARIQELSPNPLKLAGQCGKLKCCLNYEADTYADARKGFPSSNFQLKSKEGNATHQKTDVFRGIYWYAYEKNSGDITQFFPLSVERVKEIIDMNKKGVIPDSLTDEKLVQTVEVVPDYQSAVGTESLSRFDNKKTKQKHHQKNDDRKKNNERTANPNQNNNQTPVKKQNPNQASQVVKQETDNKTVELVKQDVKNEPNKNFKNPNHKPHVHKPQENRPHENKQGEQKPHEQKPQENRPHDKNKQHKKPFVKKRENPNLNNDANSNVP